MISSIHKQLTVPAADDSQGWILVTFFDQVIEIKNPLLAHPIKPRPRKFLCFNVVGSFILSLSLHLEKILKNMDEICQDDQWFEQAFTYMNKTEIPLPNDKKLHVCCLVSFLDSFH